MAVHDVHAVHAMPAAKWFFQQDGSRKKNSLFARSKNGARTTYARYVQNRCLNCFMYQNPSWIKLCGTESQERVEFLYLIVKVPRK